MESDEEVWTVSVTISAPAAGMTAELLADAVREELSVGILTVQDVTVLQVEVDGVVWPIWPDDGPPEPVYDPPRAVAGLAVTHATSSRFASRTACGKHLYDDGQLTETLFAEQMRTAAPGRICKVCRRSYEAREKP